MKTLSLTWRLYLFAALIVLVSIATMLLSVRLVGKRPEDEMGYALYDRRGALVTSQGAVLPPPSADELRIATDEVRIAEHRTVIGIGTDRVALFRHHGRPSGETILLFLLGMIGFLLVLALIATVGFARTIAVPLRKLGATARALGAGDMSVRSNLKAPGELGAVGHAFDEMAGRIEQLLRTQRAMMADISHELRTPLTRIKLALDLASADPQAAQQVLDDVGADLEEIEQIIEDVFVVVKLDSADGAVVRRSEIDVGELLVRSAERFEAHHPAHPLTFERPAAEHVAQADAALVRRAIDNLLDNAAKYSPAGTGVVLRLREDAARVAIEVIDKGIGMSTSELELAFTPFWRADTSRTRATGGVGLGLALARRIARAHGGEVELESRRDLGTVARFTIARDTVGHTGNTRS